MEKDIALGSVGKVALAFADGKASLSGVASELNGAFSQSVSISMDAGMLIDLIEAEVAKAVPASAPFDPAIFAVIKQAVVAIR